MPPISVDPEVLSGAGESIGSVGDEIAAAASTLASNLSGGARAGLDPAGLAFGHAYGQTAQALLDAGAAAVNAGRGIGFGVRMSATNYSRADASSTIGGGASTLTPPEAPADFSAPGSPSALGGGVPPPLLWSVIQTFIPDVWPDGSPAALRSTASAWQGFASTMNGIVGQLAGPSGNVAGQQIPEGGAMTSAISELTQSLSGIASEAGKLATQTQEFADDVENTQNAIRDLLDRVSPSGLWDGIQAVFSGDALEELKEIADDIKSVLEGYGHQAEGRRDTLQIGMGMIDDAVVSVEKWARREFPHYLGEDVGNALATYLDFELTLGQGILAGGVDVVEGIGQFDPLRFAYDPEGAKDAWVGMAESLGEGLLYATPTGALANPTGAFNYWKDQVTDAVHAEDWSLDRPGYGLGKILFDVGTAVVPGGPALRTTKVAADAAGDAAQAARRADVPDVPRGRVDGIAPFGQRAEDITTRLDSLDDNLRTTPMAAGPNGPAIPPSLAEPPDAPRVGDTPAPTPRAPDGPTPHVPDSTPGDRTPVPTHNSTPTATPHAPDAPVDRTPTTPHSPTPASTPAHTPAADQPAGGQHSAPTPPIGSAPAASATPSGPAPMHAPEPPAPTHAPSAAAPDVSPSGHPDSHGSGGIGSTDSRESGNSGGSHSSGNGNSAGSGISSGSGEGHSGNGGNDQSASPNTSPDGYQQDPVHSGEESGDGWHQVEDKPIDSNYGQPLTGHWESDDYPTPNDVNRSTFDLVERPAEPYGHDSDGNPLIKAEYDARYNKIGPEGQHWNNYPPNDGAVPGTRIAYDSVDAFMRDYGSNLDRVGRPSGEYMAVMPDGQPISFEARSLPVASLELPYHSYTLTGRLPDGWSIEVSEVAPAFGRDGGGLQAVVLNDVGDAVPISTMLGKVLE